MRRAERSVALVRANISKTKTLIYKIKILIYIFKSALVSNNNYYYKFFIIF